MNTAQEKRSQMLSLVDKWRGSGQTQQEFCYFYGIKIHTLSYWLGLSKEDKVPSGFIEVIYPNGVKLNLKAKV